MSVRVKICGVTRVEDAAAAVDSGADLIGLNFYPRSARALNLERALEIKSAVGRRAMLVGVFVNATRERMADVAQALALDFIQLHGDEPDDAVAGLPTPVIRALRLRPDAGPDEIANLLARTMADYVLLDSYVPDLYGGSGKALGLEQLARLDLSRAFVSGGLRPETVGEVARLTPYGVDVASGVESSPGVKDHLKMRGFIRNAKSAR